MRPPDDVVEDGWRKHATTAGQCAAAMPRTRRSIGGSVAGSERRRKAASEGKGGATPSFPSGGLQIDGRGLALLASFDLDAALAGYDKAVTDLETGGRRKPPPVFFWCSG